MGTDDVVAIVSISHRVGRKAIDREIRVATLADLYQQCRQAPPADVVRVSLQGPDGVVTLNFGAFRHSSA